jgi:hypothetical protein
VQGSHINIRNAQEKTAAQGQRNRLLHGQVPALPQAQGLPTAVPLSGNSLMVKLFLLPQRQQRQRALGIISQLVKALCNVAKLYILVGAFR